MKKPRIYLDNNATTPVDPRLYELFLESSFKTFGNPSSIHSFGQEAKAHLIKARDDIAQIIGARSQEIIFTSTATEALNMFLRGFFGPKPTGHLITSSVEHAAVFSTCQYLQTQGLDVTYLNVGPLGAPTVAEVEAAIKPDTRLICLMAANNETGVLTDTCAIAQLAYSRNIPFIVDGVALFGKEPFTLHPGISAACFSGHKFYTPKGAAFAFVRKGLKLHPHLIGGHQEHGIRAGTENLASIVALAKGAQYVTDELPEFYNSMANLRDYFEQQVIKIMPQATINGVIHGKGARIANTSNICFHDIDGEALLMFLDLNAVAASLGSACSSGAIEPSRVLINMGLTRKQALSSLRFSLSRYTTKEEIDRTIEVLKSY